MIVALRAPSLAKFGEVDTVPVSENSFKSCIPVYISSLVGNNNVDYSICLYCAAPLAAVRINFKNIRRTNKLNIALLRMCSTNTVRIASECWDTGAVRIATS